MSNDLTTVKNNLPAALQDVFNTDELAGDLYDGLQGGFAVVSFRGSKWRIKHGGEENLILKDGEAAPSIEAVIVKASKNVSKIFYDKNYEEGDDSAPDCWSIDGITPDAAAPNPQADACAGCPQNIWGSRITDSGKKGKRCGDNRRVAIVPLADIVNETMGGAMLMRVPAASLGDLATYGKGMAQKGFPYNAIGTRIGFDPDVSYPKLTFKPIRKLDEEELTAVAEHFQGDVLSSILETGSDMAPAAAPEAKPEPKPEPKPKQEAVSLDFEEEEPPKPAAKPKPAKKKAAAKKAAPKPAAVPEPEPEAAEAGGGDLDDILSDLDNLA